MSKRILPLSSCALFLLLAGARAEAQVLYVDDGAPPGGDGSSWALALNDLSLALRSAALPAIEQVWVAEGRYLPSPSDPNASFVLPDGVLVYGGFAGTETSLDQRDPAAHPTLLDGDLNGDDQPDCVGYAENSLHVVTDTSGRSTHLDGFTVRGGRGNPGAGVSLSADEVTLRRVILEENCSPGSTIGGGGLLRAERVELAGCVVRDNLAAAGAGLFLRNPQELRVTDCRFERQEGTNGGGMTIDGGKIGEIVILDSVFQDSNVSDGGGVSMSVNAFDSFRVERCTFQGNRGTSGGGISIVAVAAGTLVVSDCAFLDNTVTSGGGLFLLSKETQFFVEVLGCSFLDNHSCSGGGVFTYSGPVTVQGCEFRNNHLKGGCGLGQGGALRAEGPEARITARNSIFSRSNHGLVYALEGEVELELCSLWNGGGTVPSIRLVGAAHAELASCIVWGGAALQVAADPAASVNALYSDVRNGGTGLPGTGNFEADPLFRSQGMDDLRLQPGSPCIEAGDPARLAAGADATGGYSRMTDGDLDGVLRIDMGAHEATPVELAITGIPVAGGMLTIETSGLSGLPTFLGLDRPGQHFFPFAGTLFLALTGGFLGDWSSAPSVTQVNVPPGLAGLFHAQAIVLESGAIAFSNFVPLSF